MDKQSVIATQGNTQSWKEWSSGTFYKDEPWERHTEWNKPVTKDYMLYEIAE